MYATTRQFLDYFNLKNLDQLPALAEIRDLETLNAELGFTDPLPASLQADAAAEAAKSEVGDSSVPDLAVVGGTEHAVHDVASSSDQDNLSTTPESEA